MKIARIALCTVAACGLVVGPAALALADVPVSYEAPGVVATVTDIAPEPGETFEFVIHVPGGVLHVTLTVEAPGVPSGSIHIAGTKSLTKDAVDGTATFDVTLDAAGTFTLVATDADTGAVLASQAITVEGEATGAAVDDNGNGSGNGGGLASTGSNEVPIVVGAAALVALGAGGVLVARRRRARQG